MASARLPNDHVPLEAEFPATSGVIPSRHRPAPRLAQRKVLQLPVLTHILTFAAHPIDLMVMGWFGRAASISKTASHTRHHPEKGSHEAFQNFRLGNIVASNAPFSAGPPLTEFNNEQQASPMRAGESTDVNHQRLTAYSTNR